MAKDLDSLVRDFVTDLEAIMSGAVRSVIWYGSGASGHHVPGRSDLNFLVVVDPVSIEFLDCLQKRNPGWRKAGIAAPIVVAPSFLAQSTDSYPLEILGMLAAYRVLKGADPLKDLSPKKDDVRLQVEREAKGKELLLRRGYIESGGRHRDLLGYLVASVPGIEAILRGLLFLSGAEWKVSGQQLRHSGAQLLGLDEALLEELRNVRHRKSKPDRRQTIDLYKRTLGMFDSLAIRADRPLSAN